MHGMRTMRSTICGLAFLVVAASLWAPSVRADGMSMIVYTQTTGTVSPTGGESFTIWTFESVIPPHYQQVNDTYYPFAIEAISHASDPGVMEYLPTYTIATLCPPGDTYCHSETSPVNLVDHNGFVTGLPYECSGCVVDLQAQPSGPTESANTWMQWLNNLPTAPTTNNSGGGGADPPPVDPPAVVTPEPTGILLMMGGLGMLGIVGWRRRLAGVRS